MHFFTVPTVCYLINFIVENSLWKLAPFFLKGAAREDKGDLAGGGAEKFGADFIPDFLIKIN